ncbi:hypothetical protein GCM10011400_46100 [Paraburkholderia caffeinilytica]|uniref:Uncharacterized protein n=1 Tax=Paraburkholderia caffeinilytica TaxID=1761016 RepID=A0ABQ1N415_9BURK|nr:hypothetical protein GCM10011400_46100 [Paraburkholderia caffeinilytica]
MRRLGRETGRSGTQIPPFALHTSPETGVGRSKLRAKKNPNERFGFNPPKEEVEETAEVAELLQPMELII